MGQKLPLLKRDESNSEQVSKPPYADMAPHSHQCQIDICNVRGGKDPCYAICVLQKSSPLTFIICTPFPGGKGGLILSEAVPFSRLTLQISKKNRRKSPKNLTKEQKVEIDVVRIEPTTPKSRITPISPFFRIASFLGV